MKCLMCNVEIRDVNKAKASYIHSCSDNLYYFSIDKSNRYEQTLGLRFRFYWNKFYNDGRSLEIFSSYLCDQIFLQTSYSPFHRASYPKINEGIDIDTNLYFDDNLFDRIGYLISLTQRYYVNKCLM